MEFNLSPPIESSKFFECVIHKNTAKLCYGHVLYKSNSVFVKQREKPKKLNF